MYASVLLWKMTHGVKNYISIKEKKSYETLFKLLHCMLKNEVKNTYLESFYGVKEYVEIKLKNNIWDVNISIHATESAQTLKHQGRLTGPVVKEIAILVSDSDDLTKKHKRMVTMNYRHKKMIIRILVSFLIIIHHMILSNTH